MLLLCKEELKIKDITKSKSTDSIKTTKLDQRERNNDLYIQIINQVGRMFDSKYLENYCVNGYINKNIQLSVGNKFTLIQPTNIFMNEYQTNIINIPGIKAVIDLYSENHVIKLDEGFFEVFEYLTERTPPVLIQKRQTKLAICIWIARKNNGKYCYIVLDTLNKTIDIKPLQNINLGVRLRLLKNKNNIISQLGEPMLQGDMEYGYKEFIYAFINDKDTAKLLSKYKDLQDVSHCYYMRFIIDTDDKVVDHTSFIEHNKINKIR